MGNRSDSPGDHGSVNDEATPGALAALRSGAVIAIPTDTVYGLVALPTLPRAVTQIFTLKERPRSTQLPILVRGREQVEELSLAIDQNAERLIDQFWPGRLTLVLPFSDRDRRPSWLEGRVEAAVRRPASTVVDFLTQTLWPLVSTSANRHNHPPATTAAEVRSQFPGLFVVDGGDLGGRPSALLNLRTRPPRLERQGDLSPERIEACLETHISLSVGGQIE